jgi:hypothetical protein
VDSWETLDVTGMPDHRLLHFYENIRQQVEADRDAKCSVASGPSTRAYADALRDEIVRRRLSCQPIVWPVV